MASQFSNRYKYELLNLVYGHTYKLILMDNGYTFDRDAHEELADVTADQLATGNGYTGAITLTGGAASQNNTTDKGQLTFDDVEISASGGDIGPTPGAIVYDDTMTGDPILAYIDFGSNKTVLDGYSVVLHGIAFNLT